MLPCCLPKALATALHSKMAMSGKTTSAVPIVFTIAKKSSKNILLSKHFKTFNDPRNQFQGISSANLCSLAGRYDNPIPTSIDCLKIPALDMNNLWIPITFRTLLCCICCITISESMKRNIIFSLYFTIDCCRVCSHQQSELSFTTVYAKFFLHCYKP